MAFIADHNDVLDIFENFRVLPYADDLSYTCVLHALTIVVCFSRTWTVYRVDVVRRSIT
jgi:hypothetical protein